MAAKRRLAETALSRRASGRTIITRTVKYLAKRTVTSAEHCLCFQHARGEKFLAKSLVGLDTARRGR